MTAPFQGCWTHSNLGLMVIAWAGACAYGYCTGFFS
jgi:hypothetical protein